MAVTYFRLTLLLFRRFVVNKQRQKKSNSVFGQNHFILDQLKVHADASATVSDDIEL